MSLTRIKLCITSCEVLFILRCVVELNITLYCLVFYSVSPDQQLCISISEESFIIINVSGQKAPTQGDQ